MDKFLAVFKREYLERVRTRAFVIGTIAVPLFMSAIFLVPAYLASRTAASAKVTDIAVIDATGKGLGERVIARLTADSALRAAPKQPQLRPVSAAELPAAEERAMQEVMAKELTGYLVLTDSTAAGKSASYHGRNASSVGDFDRIRDAVRQSVMMYRLEQEGVQRSRIDELTRMSVRVSGERIDDKGRGGSAQTAIIVGFGIAILLYMSIILHGQNVLRGVMEEKTTRVAEVVLSSVKPDTLLAGKVLGVGAVGLTQQVLWLAISSYLLTQFGPLLIRPEARASGGAAASQGISAMFSTVSVELFVAVLAFFLVGFVFYATLFAAVGAMVNSDQEAQQAAAPVTILLVGTFVLVQAVIVNPNGALAVVLSWLPFSSPIVMPMRMVMAPQPWYLVAGSLLVGVLGCAGAVWLAARIYRVGMLMYGKRPSIRELARWVRYAG
jgi:ABC-2 type transport system permease protein